MDAIDALHDLSDTIRAERWNNRDAQIGALLGIQLSMEKVRQVENAKREN